MKIAIIHTGASPINTDLAPRVFWHDYQRGHIAYHTKRYTTMYNPNGVVHEAKPDNRRRSHISSVLLQFTYLLGHDIVFYRGYTYIFPGNKSTLHDFDYLVEYFSKYSESTPRQLSQDFLYIMLNSFQPYIGKIRRNPVKKPTILQDKKIDLGKYAVSLKLDGTQAYAFRVKGQTYVTNPGKPDEAGRPEMLSANVGRLQDGDLLIGEMIKGGTFYAYDILFDKYKRKYLFPFSDRYRKVVEKWTTVQIYKYPKTNEELIAVYNSLVRKMSSRGIRDHDGLIFTHVGNSWRTAYKWKPTSKLTVDLACLPGDRALYAFIANNQVTEEISKEGKLRPFDRGYLIPFIYADQKSPRPFIGEYLLNADGTPEFQRPRPDKCRPNNLITAISIKNAVNNPIELKDIGK